MPNWSDFTQMDEFAPVASYFSWYDFSPAARASPAPPPAQPVQMLSDSTGKPIYIFPTQYLKDISLEFGAPDIGGITEPGIDFAMPVGQQLYSPVDGTLHIEDKGKSDWGKRVTVKTANGYSFGIGHMSAFAAGLKEGQKVSTGAMLGLSGGDPADRSSGESTGPHIEVQWIDPSGKFVNPRQSGFIGKPIQGQPHAQPVTEQHQEQPVPTLLRLAGWSYDSFMRGFNSDLFQPPSMQPLADAGLVQSPSTEPLVG